MKHFGFVTNAELEVKKRGPFLYKLKEGDGLLLTVCSSYFPVVGKHFCFLFFLCKIPSI